MPSELLKRLVSQREDLSTELANMVKTVEERAKLEDGSDQLTEAEAKNMADIDAKATELDERITSMTAREDREAAAAAIATTIKGAAEIVEERAGGPDVKVGSEPTVYHASGEHSWVVDSVVTRGLIAGLGGVDPVAAAERLARHAKEMEVLHERDTTTTSYAGLVPPNYLVNEFTPNLRAGRPFANLCNGMSLPPVGMTMTIPRATAGTTVSTQATQNTAPSTTDVGVTDLSVPVISFQGRGVISRQSLERGAVNIDRIVFQDLAADAARYIDQQALYGSGASGNALGAINTASILTVTITATTGIGLINALANAIQQINTQRLLPPDVIVMHPRRWGALTIAVDGNGRPLVTVESGQTNVFGQGSADLVQQTVGSILGLPVVTDPNLRTNLGAGTNEDEIVVMRRGDQFLWEQPGTVREFTLEQPVGPQSIQLAVYGNAAFTAARYPKSVAYISGTGLVPPTF